MRFQVVALTICLGTDYAMASTRIDTIPPGVAPDYATAANGLRALCLFKTRVRAEHEFWLGGYEYDTFYYEGDSAVLNTFLKEYAKLRKEDFHPIEPFTVRIHDEGYLNTSKTARRDDLSYNWTLRVANVHPWDPSPFASDRFSVSVDIILSSHLSLSDLEIPENVRVVSATTVDEFVRKHEKKRLGSDLAVEKEHLEELQKKIEMLDRAHAMTRPASSNLAPTTQRAP
jgi:hypothetical protein